MAESQSRPIVHLFVGLHKTGSTAVRFMLDLHRDLFPHHGFYIPRATWTRDLGQNFNGGHINLSFEICGHHPPLPQYGSLADLVWEISERPQLQHILFSEDFAGVTPDQLRKLAEAFASFDVRIIIFLRNQVDYLSSFYIESNKWIGAASRQEWCAKEVGRLPMLDQHAFCSKWAEAFGTPTIVCYERIHDRVLDAFLECCGAPSALRVTLAAHRLPKVNASPDERALELIRHASAYAASIGIRPEFFNAVLSPALGAASRQIFGVRKGRPGFDPGTEGALRSIMQASSAALMKTFGLQLGPEYTDPVFPAQLLPGEPEALEQALQSMARLVVSAACDIGTRMGARIQKLGQEAALPDGSQVRAELRALAADCHPWGDGSAAPGPDLAALVAAVLEAHGDALFLERIGTAGTASSRIDGRMVRQRELDPGQWQQLVRTIEARARLNSNAWNSISEGQLPYERDGRAHLAPVRHAPTADGEILILEFSDDRLPEPAPPSPEGWGARIRARVEHWKAEGPSIALAPAGRFARSLLSHTALREAHLVAFFDRAPAGPGASCDGRPVHAYGELHQLNPDYVLVASPVLEDEIVSAIQAEGFPASRIVRLSELPI